MGGTRAGEIRQYSVIITVSLGTLSTNTNITTHTHSVLRDNIISQAPLYDH